MVKLSFENDCCQKLYSTIYSLTPNMVKLSFENDCCQKLYSAIYSFTPNMVKLSFENDCCQKLYSAIYSYTPNMVKLSFENDCCQKLYSTIYSFTPNMVKLSCENDCCQKLYSAIYSYTPNMVKFSCGWTVIQLYGRCFGKLRYAHSWRTVKNQEDGGKKNLPTLRDSLNTSTARIQSCSFPPPIFFFKTAGSTIWIGIQIKKDQLLSQDVNTQAEG